MDRPTVQSSGWSSRRRGRKYGPRPREAGEGSGFRDRRAGGAWGTGPEMSLCQPTARNLEAAQHGTWSEESGSDSRHPHRERGFIMNTACTCLTSFQMIEIPFAHKRNWIGTWDQSTLLGSDAS